MLPGTRRTVAAMLLSSICIAGCAKSSDLDSEPAENGGAARVESAGGVDRVVLSARAEQRLGIRTARIARVGGAAARRRVIPADAIVYDASGRASTFTSPAPHTFVERPITVGAVSHGRAVLTSGPPAGTSVVVVGAPELAGTASGVEEE